MATFQNTFSWSFSAGKAFEGCPRKRYWDKYAKWGGWREDAPSLTRKAYVLSKMTSRKALAGHAVEIGLEAMLDAARKGASPTVDDIFEADVRPVLRRQWNESTQRAWERNPRLCNLHEHYYPSLHEGEDRDHIHEVAHIVRTCLAHFHASILPRLKDLPPDDIVPIALVGQGDPEHFTLREFKIYAIPDFVFRRGNDWHIIDWKSGARREEHLLQLGVYALWAHLKHDVPPEHIHVSLEYLQEGATVTHPVDPAFLAQAEASVLTSIQDMAAYLERGDLQRNQPIPLQEWDLTPDLHLCTRCNFLELCRPELEALDLWPPG